MIKAIFNDGTEIEVLENTTVYPSGSSMVRSYMDIHCAENAMTIAEFEAILSTEDKTKTITIKKTDGDDVIYEDTFTSFVILAKVGKETVQSVDTATGTVTEEKHLVARLEQLTYIEQKLHDLGIL